MQRPDRSNRYICLIPNPHRFELTIIKYMAVLVVNNVAKFSSVAFSYDVRNALIERVERFGTFYLVTLRFNWKTD